MKYMVLGHELKFLFQIDRCFINQITAPDLINFEYSIKLHIEGSSADHCSKHLDGEA